MSFPKDLDEIDTDKLRFELLRRDRLIDRGLCPYCRKPVESDLCKEVEQHLEARKESLIRRRTQCLSSLQLKLN